MCYRCAAMPDRTTQLRVGLLGCGRIAASIHLPILASLGQVAVVALAEPDEARRRNAARHAPEAASFADSAEALARAELEAVVITLPNALHASVAQAAFLRGLHVYLEKPLALCASEGREVLRACQTAGTVGMIGYNYRFLPQYQRARAVIQSGHLGKVVALRSIFSSQSPLPDWKRRRETGGGVLLDLVSHHLDLAAWLVGEPPQFVACDLHSRSSDDDTALLHLEFPSGIRAQFIALFGGPEQHRFEILGERGGLVVNPDASDLIETRNATMGRVRLNQFLEATRALASPAYWMRKATGEQWRVSYRRALSCFVNAALNREQPQPDLTAGCATLAWLDAARESARQGCKIAVQPFGVENSRC